MIVHAFLSKEPKKIAKALTERQLGFKLCKKNCSSSKPTKQKCCYHAFTGLHKDFFLNLKSVKKYFSSNLKGKPNLDYCILVNHRPFYMEAFSDSAYGGSNLDRNPQQVDDIFLVKDLSHAINLVGSKSIADMVQFHNTKIHIDKKAAIMVSEEPSLSFSEQSTSYSSPLQKRL
ncbi:hypothetical protein Tco_0077359 [Tanacetum coccineum]|uniref:Uncharacterized protein n=1 Tax=Tanacetum coccineum TaxID=301880 RepID=A0ABQ5AAV1_9ASTR